MARAAGWWKNPLFALLKLGFYTGVFGGAFTWFFLSGLGRQFDRASGQAPPLEGLPLEVVKNTAAARGLRVTVREFRASASAPKGTVLVQEPPAGTAMRAAQAITLVVSAGKEAVTAPPLAGLDPRDAESRLAALKLVAGRASYITDEAGAGKVLGQSPPPGTALIEGEPVSLLIGRAPPPARFVMPDLRGRSAAEVVNFFNRKKFLVQVEGPAAGRVTRQFPAAGGPLTAGTQVRLESSDEDPADPGVR